MGKVEICNEALDAIGGARIASLDEDSVPARHCRNHLARTHLEMQASYDWNFNKTVRDLAALTERSMLPGYEYIHNLPADFLRLSDIVRPEGDERTPELDHTYSPITGSDRRDALRWFGREDSRFTRSFLRAEVAGTKLHTVITPIRLIYHANQDIEGELPPLYRLALVDALALRFVPIMLKDPAIEREKRDMAMASLRSARDADDNPQVEFAPTGSVFRDGRL